MQDVDYGHTQYIVMNLATKDSMTDDRLEEIEDTLANLLLEEEDFQPVQRKYKSYSHA